MIAQRANWAATTPWAGITGKPEFPSVFVTDIGQLTGAGFTNGQVPVWNSAQGKFVPYTIPSPSGGGGSLPSQFTLTWDIPLLAPLQTATQTFNVANVYPTYPIAIAWNCDPGFMWFWGLITDIQVLTLYAKNMDAVPITFGEINVTVQRFN